MSSKKNKFYITTTLAYVNAAPHIGFAAEIVRADVLARYHRLIGDEVFFNTGTDEHGQKIYKKAFEQGKDPQDYCDEYAGKFSDLKNALNLSYDNFIRTTDQKHIQAVQDFWKKCVARGDIYKKNYQVKYCIGCEMEKTESELVNGFCPLHPGQELEIINEENYFFRWSNYQERLLRLYVEHPDFVIPANRLLEIKNFVESGLQDFSISRLRSKMPWGIAVPGDDDHVVYVWFDALVNYISALGYPDESFKSWWPGMQVAGKDNLRQQAAMWQAMLMSADIETAKQVLIFGFITSNGQKMSKSLGNVVNPLDLVEKYGSEATRYYLLAEIKPFEDSDFTWDKFEAKYTADLANGLGNLIARISALIEKNNLDLELAINNDTALSAQCAEKINHYEFDEALKILWEKLRYCDEILTTNAPWKLTDQTEVKKILEAVAQDILNVAYHLQPFLPQTAEIIIEQFSQKQIKKGENLFPRIK